MPNDTLSPDEVADQEALGPQDGADTAANIDKHLNGQGEDSDNDQNNSSSDRLKDANDLREKFSSPEEAGVGEEASAGEGLAAGGEGAEAAGSGVAAEGTTSGVGGGTAATGAGAGAGAEGASLTGSAGIASGSAATTGTGAAVGVGEAGGVAATAATGSAGVAAASSTAAGGLAAAAPATGPFAPAALTAALAAAAAAAAQTAKGRMVFLGALIASCGCFLAPLGLGVLVIFFFLFPILIGFEATSTAEASNPNGSIILIVKKTVSPTKIDTGAPPTTVSYSISVTNTSDKEATGVSLKDEFSSNPNTSFSAEVSTQIAGKDLATNITIPPGATINKTFTVTVGHTDFVPGWVLSNKATVIGTINGKAETSTSSAYVVIGKVGCGGGGNFTALLPNPIPAHPTVSGGSIASENIGRLFSGGVIPAAISASLATGLPCEVLVGIHWVEAGWNDDGSFISGRTIGTVETDLDPADCEGFGAKSSLSPAGCVFPDLNTTAVAAARVYMGKISNVFGHDSPADFGEMVSGFACYNGCPGNANCGAVSAYTGPCPPPLGIDNPYAVNWLDNDHATMYLRYCSDGTPCVSPPVFTRDGAARAALDFYLNSTR